MLFGPVVQLVRTLACHARGRGFEPHPDRQVGTSFACSDFFIIQEENLYDISKWFYDRMAVEYHRGFFTSI